MWWRGWEQVIPFFAFAPNIRKIIKARGHFPSDEVALKLIWLALPNVVAKWTGSRHDWKSAVTQFALLYPEPFNIGL